MVIMLFCADFTSFSDSFGLFVEILSPSVVHLPLFVLILGFLVVFFALVLVIWSLLVVIFSRSADEEAAVFT